MKPLATAMLLAALAAGSPAGAAPVEAPVAASAAPALAAGHLRRALAAGDGGTVAALLAEDASILEEGHFETRAQYLAGHLAADLAFAQATAFDLTHQTTAEAGDLAYVVSEGRVRGTYKARAIDSVLTETMVLRRDGAGWKIVHIHWSSRPAAAD